MFTDGIMPFYKELKNHDLYQKSDTKKAAFLIEKRLFKQWAMMGSNHRPKDYESSTLTS